MQTIILTKGAPASLKSTWAREEVAKDPNNSVRFNNDDIRNMLNSSVYSKVIEKLVTETRLFLIREALKNDIKTIIVDNVNTGKHFETICKIAQESGKDVQVIEKPFYADLEILIERDSKREGKSKVGEMVVKKFFKDLGGKQFQFYQPKTAIFAKSVEQSVKPIVQDQNLPKAVIFDNDGTISLVHSGRSPYDASTCDLDEPHPHAIECMKLYHNAGYKIIFLSGREEKNRAPTERFYQKHFPEVKYELFLRADGDKRKDAIIKEEIISEHILGKYFIAGIFDDRLQVCRSLYKSGYPIFRLGDPEATF